jgi:hypothetical protein
MIRSESPYGVSSPVSAAVMPAPGARRGLTADCLPALHPVRGRNGFCGPAAIAALTGRTTDEAAALLRRKTGRRRITATSPLEVLPVLRHLGYSAERFQIFRAGEKVSLRLWWECVASVRRGAYLVATTRHFQVVFGDLLVCSLRREPFPVADLPYNVRFVRAVWSVTFSSDLAANDDIHGGES